jgi:hypothetical protein
MMRTPGIEPAEFKRLDLPVSGVGVRSRQTAMSEYRDGDAEVPTPLPLLANGFSNDILGAVSPCPEGKPAIPLVAPVKK